MANQTTKYRLYLKSNRSPEFIPRRTRLRIKKRSEKSVGLHEITGSSQPDQTGGADQTLHEPSSDIVINFGHSSINSSKKRKIMPECNVDSELCETQNVSEETDNDTLPNGIPMYDGDKLSNQESILAVFEFMAKHKLTRQATSDLLQLISLFLPQNSPVLPSYYSLMKLIPKETDIWKFHYYCPQCEDVMESDGELSCTNCKLSSTEKELTNSGNFCIFFDIKQCLESILKDQIITKELNKNLEKRRSKFTGVIADITDGKKYKSLGLSKYDISCTFNTDGVPLFKSSKFSLWPIIISINELSYKSRCRSNFLGALWFGNEKPNFDTFFTPFVSMCNELSRSGIDWVENGKNKNSRVFFPIMVADSVARSPCQGIHQFNGSYGCSWCLAPGENLIVGETSRKWVYPSNCKSAPERTKTIFLKHVRAFSEKLENNPKLDSHFGIKSASKLMLLPKFDIVDGFTYDYMHSAFLGISRSFLNNWLDSKNHTKPFYIGKSSKLVDGKLLKYLVPFCYDRAVRSVDHRKFWKATEWRTWTFVSINVLKGILPQLYLKHFSKFVVLIMLLSSESVSVYDIDNAKILIQEFLDGVERLYGLEYCSFNCHILMHAPKSVLNWGPLWAYSAFQFENYNDALIECLICNWLSIQCDKKIAQPLVVHF